MIDDKDYLTEEEAKKALFDVHFNYMVLSPEERVKHYDEYIEKRNVIKRKLSRLKINKMQEENNSNLKK